MQNVPSNKMLASWQKLCTIYLPSWKVLWSLCVVIPLEKNQASKHVKYEWEMIVQRVKVWSDLECKERFFQHGERLITLLYNVLHKLIAFAILSQFNKVCFSRTVGKYPLVNTCYLWNDDISKQWISSVLEISVSYMDLVKCP